MKLKPVSENPLCRWSRGLQWPSQLRLPNLHLGMQGCGAALNATNCIRTCLYLGARAPTFLNAKSFNDVASLERNGDGTLDDSETSLARFSSMADPSLPTVVLENFVPGARTIEGFDFPERCNIIAGHENTGVSADWLAGADHVVFIPQYGTISSMNVVSSAGVAMYYYHMSQRRARLSKGAFASPQEHQHQPIKDGGVEDSYVARFANSIPKDEQGERMDKRPIHPALYHLDNDAIAVQHKLHTASVLLGPSKQHLAEDVLRKGDPLFKLAVLYENEEDTRNLGGLIRNANSYLASVLYFGKRKINKQGSVGSDHYTDIHHLGSPRDDPSTLLMLQEKVLRGRGMEVWELCLEQDCLYASDDAVVSAAPVVALDDDEMLLREVFEARRRSPGGIAIVVPQEGQPASRAVRAVVNRRVQITTPRAPQELHRGLPSQVGAAITLQRVFWALLATRE